MTHPYTEDQLVEQPALELLKQLGWKTLCALDERFGEGGTLGRETRGEVILLPRLRKALGELNPGHQAEELEAAIDELIRDRSAMSLEAANREIYRLLKDGIALSIPDRDHGGQKIERLRFVDWEQPRANDLLAVNQFSLTGSLYTCRPDLVCFVNGLPWVVIEFKKPGLPERAAFDGNLTHYKAQLPSLFWYNAFMIASNGTASRLGSISADWNRFFEWKRVASEREERRVSLDVILRGTCDPACLFDLVENFTLFSESKAGLVKIVGQNHQYLGVNGAIASLLEARKLGHGRGGVFWQTQGSGKSFSMVFFAQKILRKLPGNWTFVVLTDRVELDEQIAATFKAAGAVSEAEGELCHAGSGADLRELLRGNHRYVFTLIHKFQTSELLSDRSDIVVLSDEAHRSQYDGLALNMRSALPKALFLAFTGTPLIAGEERTRDVFGDYVSIYDFRQSVEDGATVPLFYENRAPELELVNPELNDQIYDLVDEADLDPEQEKRLESELSRQYHILTRDDRLDTLAADIVRHFLGRGFQGKAMVISIDKATALKMHDKVRRLWVKEKKRVEAELGRLAFVPADEGPTSSAQRADLERRRRILDETDMALVVSPAQNEIARMRALGLDMEPHRRRMNESNPGLDERFKNTEDPLRLVFVCAMWLTGFDAPSCSTLYLDKPMRNHTLMQTIARANRVFPGKHSGLIVDYANVFASLEKALAIYGGGREGRSPVQDKRRLVDELKDAIAETRAFCASKGVDLAALELSPEGSLARLGLFGFAVDALIAPDRTRDDFLALVRLVGTLHDAVKPDPVAAEFSLRRDSLDAIASTIRRTLYPERPDISALMSGISDILDRSIVGITIKDAGAPPLDLSKINFEALAERFKRSKRKNTDLEALKAIVRARIERMLRLNPTRIDFAQKLESLIADYNAGSRNIEQLFEELLKLSLSLDEEQERHLREHLSEEELVIFDILTRPAPELSSEEVAEIKKVAHDLFARIKDLLVLNWRQKVAARSRVQEAIKTDLDEGLPRVYTPELYDQKCAALFEHFYERYPERDDNAYSRAV
jgi:type I restriction enzyme R subunit